MHQYRWSDKGLLLKFSRRLLNDLYTHFPRQTTIQGLVYDINSLRPRQNGRHFADDICKCIFLNENVRISIKISLKFVPKGLINNNPALVQIMAWRRSGDKPLSEPMMVSLLTHICVTRPQWVKNIYSWWLFNKVKPVLLVDTPRWSTICTIYNQYENVLHILFGSRSYKTGSHWCFGVCLETSFNLKTRKLVSIMARAVL